MSIETRGFGFARESGRRRTYQCTA